MAKIKQIKPSDRKKLYPYMDEKELPSWDPTWCYPEDDEKMMIAAWDCWDINHNNFEKSSSSTSLIESSSKTDFQEYFDLTKCDNKPITKFNQSKVSSNVRGLVDVKLSIPKDDHILSDNYEKTLKYVETSQRETLFKSSRENLLHKVSAKNDTILTSEDPKSLNLTSTHENTIVPLLSSKLIESRKEVRFNFDTFKFGLQENRSTNSIKEISNLSNNTLQQMKIVKEHSRKYEHNKKEESTSLQSQSVGVLIDLDGLDDWLNKTTITSKNNQLEQRRYQTEEDKARKNNFNLNDKISYEDLLEFDLLMQK